MKNWDITIDEFQFDGKNYEINANVDREISPVGHRQYGPEGRGEDQWGPKTLDVTDIEMVEWDSNGRETPVDVGSLQNRKLVDAAKAAVMERAEEDDVSSPKSWGSKPNVSETDKLSDIVKEVVGEVLDEKSSTGAVGGYNTPRAFQGPGDAERKKALAQKSMPGGKVVGEDVDQDEKTVDDRLPMVRRTGISEGRGRYYNFRESDIMRAHSKVSYGIKEAHTMLKEVEFLLNICERFKTESGVSNDSLWKRTKPDMMKINMRLKEIAKRINRLNK